MTQLYSMDYESATLHSSDCELKQLHLQHKFLTSVHQKTCDEIADLKEELANNTNLKQLIEESIYKNGAIINTGNIQHDFIQFQQHIEQQQYFHEYTIQSNTEKISVLMQQCNIYEEEKKKSSVLLEELYSEKNILQQQLQIANDELYWFTQQYNNDIPQHSTITQDIKPKKSETQSKPQIHKIVMLTSSAQTECIYNDNVAIHIKTAAKKSELKHVNPKPNRIHTSTVGIQTNLFGNEVYGMNDIEKFMNEEEGFKFSNLRTPSNHPSHLEFELQDNSSIDSMNSVETVEQSEQSSITVSPKTNSIKTRKSYQFGNPLFSRTQTRMKLRKTNKKLKYKQSFNHNKWKNSKYFTNNPFRCTKKV